MSEKELAHCVGVMYEAESDTTTMALQSFILAALTYSDGVEEAQRQPDHVVGADCPTFEDRDRLPIVDAVPKETCRWSEFAVFRRTDKSYMKPSSQNRTCQRRRHTTCHRSERRRVHGLLHPERINGARQSLDDRPRHWGVWRRCSRLSSVKVAWEPDLPLAPFGYGRRLCTGQYVAINSLYINIARLL